VRSDIVRRFERLEATRERVLRRLEGHDRATLNRPPARGGWSALQVLSHVILAEGATLEYIGKKMKAGTDLPRAGIVSRLRLLVLQAVLGSPLRFRAPTRSAGVPDDVDPDALRSSWDKGRSAWRERLSSFPPELMDRMVLRHPYMGLMGLHDTLAFMLAHLEHHARQVDRILAGHSGHAPSAPPV
jgi:DinB superfamily